MNRTKFCELCELQKMDFHKGSRCGVTDALPTFTGNCPKIVLQDKFQNKLKEVNVQYTKESNFAPYAYTYFFIFVAVGLAIILGGVYMMVYLWDHAIISTGPISVMVIGAIPLGMAFAVYNGHRTRMKINKRKKQLVDEVLKEYRITYDYTVKFGKKIHGDEEVFVDFQLQGGNGITFPKKIKESYFLKKEAHVPLYN
ncbi:hypothetical protein SAMN05216480_11544 [Pustulibacterium marinum]|uniref:Uncharacterized protein n=1 Tax=Pustulibacterium marinum TaxID=1224947 RepID=A0A1I7IDU9_9FLAO|nr:hypothetical protein [Pustulibacterium marinum]SFU71082.1 hypothetical protein SAMN05216480_11544 [Pustulibacterium marinum]